MPSISANSWPGWQDEGIKITASDLVFGMDMARLNLRLAKELKRDDDVLANAHWLVGAHHLAAGQQQPAIEQFAASINCARAAKKPAIKHMSAGYLGIANRLGKSTREQGNQQLAAAIAALNKINNEDAKFFASQLESVGRFLKSSGEGQPPSSFRIPNSEFRIRLPRPNPLSISTGSTPRRRFPADPTTMRS